MANPKQSPPPPAGVARVPMKSTLPDTELQRYRDSGSLIELQPGQTLIEEGDGSWEMYAVLRGVLGVFMDGVQIAEISEGQVAGEMAFFLEEPRTATLRALTVCEVHAISPQKMRVLLQHPDVAFGLIKLFARRVEASNLALKVRTQTAIDSRLALEEERQLHERTRTQLAAARANLEPGNVRIAALEQALHGLGYELKPDGVLTRRFAKPAADLLPAAEAREMEDDLALLAPPPAPVPPPLPMVPKLKDMGARRDETISYAQGTRAPLAEPVAPAEPGVFAEVDTAELTVVEEPPRGPVQAPRQKGIPVGARTQTMAAFDPDAPLTEYIVDERGSRPSQPTIEQALASETDELLAEILSLSPDAQPKKG